MTDTDENIMPPWKLAAEKARQNAQKNRHVQDAISKREKPQQPTQTVQPPRQLSLLPGEAAIPNVFLRSALFGIVKRGRRARLEDYQALPTYGKHGWGVSWRGVQLDQADLDVWAAILRDAARDNPDFLNGRALDQPAVHVKFTRNRLLKATGRSIGGQNRKWLDASIMRLCDCRVQVEDPDGKRRYSATLLGERFEDDESDMEVIEVNAKLAQLLGADIVTLINYGDRLALGQDSLAKWLQGFLNSHMGPIYQIRLSKLQRICGSNCQELKAFCRDVKRALKKLSADVKSFAVTLLEDGDYSVCIELTKRKRGGV